MSAHAPVTAEELAEVARNFEITNGQNDVGSGAYELAKVRLALIAPRLAHDLAERTAELAAIAVAVEEAGIVPRPGDTLLARVHRLIADANQIEEQRDTLARVIEARDDEAEAEKTIRAESAIRNDERQRAEAEHRALADEGRQRDANRIERLEGEIARLRVIVDDADRAKAEHEKTRDELRRLHDVLSGKRGAP